MDEVQTRRCPAQTGHRGENMRLGGRDHDAIHLNSRLGANAHIRIGVYPIDRLIPLLAGVRQYGTGWRADCPTGHRSRGTLAVGVGDDGRVLLHCHAGCDAADVLAAVGLTLADLYPDRPRDLSPMGRRAARDAMRSAHWSAALGVLSAEATVIEVAAVMIERGEPLSPDDVARVHVAAQRIHGCREVLR